MNIWSVYYYYGKKLRDGQHLSCFKQNNCEKGLLDFNEIFKKCSWCAKEDPIGVMCQGRPHILNFGRDSQSFWKQDIEFHSALIFWLKS